MYIYNVTVVQHTGNEFNPVITTKSFKSMKEAIAHIDVLDAGYIESGRFEASERNVPGNRCFRYTTKNTAKYDIHVFMSVSEI